MPESIIINFVHMFRGARLQSFVLFLGGGSIDSEGDTMNVKSRSLGQIMRYQQADINVFCRLSKVTYHALLSLLSLPHFM